MWLVFSSFNLQEYVFLYAHFFSSKLVWFFSGPVKSKRYETNKCVRSNYISKNPFCKCCHNVLKHILKEHCYFMRHCFAVKPNYCNYLSILYHVYSNVYLPAVNRQGHFGHRDIFCWIFGSFCSKTSAAWKSDKGNAHLDYISPHCSCLRRREYNRVVFCWLTSSHLVLHKAVNAIFFGVSRLYI